MSTAINNSSVSYWSNYSGAYDFTKLTQLASSLALARSSASATSSSSYSSSSNQVSASASSSDTSALQSLLIDIDGKLTELINFQKAQSASLPDAGGYGVTTSQKDASYVAPQNVATGASAQLDSSNSFIQQTAHYLSANTLSFSDAKAILTEAGTGDMTADKMAALQAIAKNLNASGAYAITASDYVKQMFDNVVLGNTRNDKAGGNLTASSTQAQMTALVDKWFGGSDNPNIDVHSHYMDFYGLGGSLFGTGPQASDVNQGRLADSSLLASLAALAAANPGAIQDMITDNQDGTYGVRFYLNGEKQYVTVDSKLAVMNEGTRNDKSIYEYNSGSNGTLWSQIAEKAYAEFLSEVNGGSNDMANLSTDGDWYLSAGLKVTGADFAQTALQNNSTTHYSLNSDSAANGHYAAMKTFLGNQISTALSSGQIVTMDAIAGGRTGQVFENNNLVGNHRFAVVGYNSNTQTVTLDNPWNANGTITPRFTMKLDELAAQNVRFNVNGGSVMTA